VDVFQFHNVGPAHYEEIVERLYPAAVRLKEQGKIRAIGLTERQEGRHNPSADRSLGDPAHRALAHAVADGIWDTIGLKYGILNQVAEREALPLAAERNVGVMNMSSIRIMLAQPDQLEAVIADWKASGLLEPSALPDRDPLGFLVHDDVPSVIAAGYKLAVDHPAISTVVIGTGSATHLEQNVAAVLGPPLPPADRERLRTLFGDIIESV
jgi:aryl-alcohol dehydrogenase-like predicted oxidoreductase